MTAPAQPRPLPADPATGLFQVELHFKWESPVLDEWHTVAWAMTRMWADDIAVFYLARGLHDRARVWNCGRVVAEHTSPGETTT